MLQYFIGGEHSVKLLIKRRVEMKTFSRQISQYKKLHIFFTILNIKKYFIMSET